MEYQIPREITIDNMDSIIKILHFEANPKDTEILRITFLQHKLRVHIYPVIHKKDYETSLLKQRFDVVISDFPTSNDDAKSALLALQSSGQNIPFILFSEPIGDQNTAMMFKLGASDTVPKTHPQQLPLSLQQALSLYEEKKQLKESGDLYKSLMNTTQAGLFKMETDGRWSYVNPQLCQLAGKEAAFFLNNGWQRVIHADDKKQVMEEWKQAIAAQKNLAIDFRLQPDDSLKQPLKWLNVQMVPYTSNDHKVIGFIGTIFDITHFKKSSRLSTHDILTELPNRHLFMEILEQTLARSKRYKRMFVLVLCDLDHFKNVNDTLGHPVGDILLKAVADRFRDLTRKSDLVARLGGDEFAIILDELNTLDDIHPIVERFQKAFEESFSIQGYKCYTTLSIGIVPFQQQNCDSHHLLKQADQALYKAKAAGRNQFQYYTKELNQKVTRTVEIENQLRNSLLTNQEFFLHFQPQINLQNNKMVGLETLVRWQNATLGRLEPREFIPIAETTGLIYKIGRFVLHHALDHYSTWSKKFVNFSEQVKLSINISPQQLLQSWFREELLHTLHKYHVSVHSVILELTEPALMFEKSQLTQTLEKLTKDGFQIAIDDFGTGYSSLMQLKKLPIQALKIDGTFIRDLHKDPNDQAIVKATIQIAKTMSLKVIAECPEIEEQISLLREYHCDVAQGNYFSPPLDAEGMNLFIQRHFTQHKSQTTEQNG